MSKQPTAEISHTRSCPFDFCVRRRDFPMTEAQNVPPRNRPSFVESVTPANTCEAQRQESIREILYVQHISHHKTWLLNCYR